jgi:hypothetical protein
MQLEDFVAQALAQLARGVMKAQGDLQDSEARVVPKMERLFSGSSSTNEAFGWAEATQDTPVFLVDFDVAVTVVEGTETKGGIGVVVGAFALGSQGRSDSTSSAVSRMKFKVPFLLPVHKSRRPT